VLDTHRCTLHTLPQLQSQHELFELPLRTSAVSYKRMGIDWTDAAQPQWTYKLEEGCCTNSLAFQTAKVRQNCMCKQPYISMHFVYTSDTVAGMLQLALCLGGNA
jgi:hypothetical protein